jgi:hypothetical protein
LLWVGPAIKTVFRIIKLLNGTRAPSDKVPKQELSPDQLKRQLSQDPPAEPIGSTSPATVAMPPMWFRDP